jgi:D-alanine-D-alanine ligase
LDELRTAFDKIRSEQRDDAIVQTFLPGREFTVSLLGNSDPEILGITEIRNKKAIFDFEEKYSGPAEYEICPAEIPEGLENFLKRKSCETYAFLGCHGMARIDWRCDSGGNPHFLEINTIPGMTSASILPKAAKYAGYDEKTLTDALVRLAEEI